MSDFMQNGVITTLHHLGERSVTELERELVTFSRARPMTLVLPSLYSELEGPALPRITSYNVCYTKLLRPTHDSCQADGPVGVGNDRRDR